MFFDPREIGPPATSATSATFGADSGAVTPEKSQSRKSRSAPGIPTTDPGAPAHRHTWLVTTTEGEVFSLSRTPPATLAEIEADYPGATIEIEPEPPIGPALHPDDLALAHAYLRHIGETDLATGQEWIAGLARDPERLRQMYAEAVRLGIATYAPPPPAQPIEDASRVAVCALCLHWTPSPVNPKGGMGRCREDAPASRKAGSLWPWDDTEIRCDQFRGTPQ